MLPSGLSLAHAVEAAKNGQLPGITPADFFVPPPDSHHLSILGHYSWTFDDPLFRILLFRGMLWSADANVDRFNELATMGLERANGE